MFELIFALRNFLSDGMRERLSLFGERTHPAKKTVRNFFCVHKLQIMWRGMSDGGGAEKNKLLQPGTNALKYTRLCNTKLLLLSCNCYNRAEFYIIL